LGIKVDASENGGSNMLTRMKNRQPYATTKRGSREKGN